MRTTLVFMLSYLMLSVYAGPGTHQYNTDTTHSNYGNEKMNKQHIQEHIKAMAKDDTVAEKPEPTEKEMIYYLFVIHDTNGDGYLDGHELRAAFTDFDHDEKPETEDLIPLDEVNAMVDHVLLEDDKNGDGLISWSEYLESQLYHDD